MPRHFAVIPAAGISNRMGQPKLLLPLTGKPLVLHTIEAWRRSKIDRIAIVIRSDDAPLIEAVRGCHVDIVTPDVPPPDMKSSVQAALRHIEVNYQPVEGDAFLVAPADMPRLSPQIIDRLIDLHAANPTNQILAPTLQGRRGHPVLFPWSLSTDVQGLTNAGLDSIVHQHGCVTLACDDLVQGEEFPFADIDTPDEYRAMQGNSFR